MARLGWQALLLVPLVVLIYGLWRALRTRAGRLLAPGARFLLLSILAHAGLLFALDLVLITVPVVEAHSDLIEAAIVKTFSIFPSGRGGSSPSWERVPEGPPPAEPDVAPTESRVVALKGPAFDPALVGIAPTIPESVARMLPPDRVLFVPRPSPAAADAPPAELARAVSVEPELPAPEPPRLDRVELPPEPAPEPPAVSVGRRDADPGPAAPAPAVPPFGPLARAFESLPAPAPASVPEREPVMAPLSELPRARAPRIDDPGDALPAPEGPPPVAVSEPPPFSIKEPPATLPKASVKEKDLARGPEPPLRDLPRLEPQLRVSLPTLALPPPRPDALSTPLPEMRLPAPTGAVALAIEPPDLAASFSLRPPEVRKDLVKAMGGTETSEAAVERGLAWLAAHQAAAGNWSLEDLHCQGHHCDAPGSARSDAGATGLALMALLGAGNSPAGGTHAAVVRRGVDWLVAHQRPDGSLAEPSGSQMYGHALATIALCEALGLGADPALRGPSERAVRFIVAAQDPKTGGWRYAPRAGGDTSVFGWQVMAMKSAEMAGLPVPPETYRLAARWLDAVASGPDRQLYAYQPGREVRASMTAEALLCRQYLGASRTAGSMTSGGRYLRSNLPQPGARHSYYWYYGTQVMFHLQGDDWAAWNSTVRDMLVNSQAKDGPSAGSWDPLKPSPDKWGKEGGRLYETTLSLLILEVYYRHLPLYQQLSGHDAVN